jgi:hypothetical protein
LFEKVLAYLIKKRISRSGIKVKAPCEGFWKKAVRTEGSGPVVSNSGSASNES